MEFFNSEFAHQQLSGNHDILCRLLTKFIDDYQNAESEIKEMIAAQNYTSAHLMIHTLKGVSGNLGLERLHQFCKQSEPLARDEHLRSDDVNELSNLIAETAKHINLYINETAHNKVVGHVPKHPAAEPKAVLYEFITKNQFIPFEKLEHLLNSLHAEEEDIQELRASIQILDYEKALAIMEKI